MVFFLLIFYKRRLSVPFFVSICRGRVPGLLYGLCILKGDRGACQAKPHAVRERHGRVRHQLSAVGQKEGAVCGVLILQAGRAAGEIDSAVVPPHAGGTRREEHAAPFPADGQLRRLFCQGIASPLQGPAGRHDIAAAGFCRDAVSASSRATTSALTVRIIAFSPCIFVQIRCDDPAGHALLVQDQRVSVLLRKGGDLGVPVQLHDDLVLKLPGFGVEQHEHLAVDV